MNNSVLSRYNADQFDLNKTSFSLRFRLIRKLFTASDMSSLWPIMALKKNPGLQRKLLSEVEVTVTCL